MASREINLWIDERWYDALSKHLNDNPNYIIQVGNVFGFIISIENIF